VQLSFKIGFLRLAALALTVALCLATPLAAKAAPDIQYGQSYISYTYNFEGDPVATPAAYEAVLGLTGYDIGEIPFKDLSDITYDGNDRLYIADSGNNRIVVLNAALELQSIIDHYAFNGEAVTFSEPSCTAVSAGYLYIADTQNARIVVLNATTFETDRVLEQPEIAALGDFTYLPTKLTVDYAGRIYVIAKNINKGLIQLDAQGNFENFLGAPKVSPTISEILMRKFFSKAMREKLIKNVPTEYNAVNIDKEGFLFVTSQSSNIPPIARLNGQGTNVLAFTYETPRGDGYYIDENGKQVESMFVDIVPREDGGYFALDSQNGRIFSYDSKGILLYIFGSSGTSRGSFYSASSLEYVGERILVADKSTGILSVFSLTEFGDAVNTAAMLSNEGKTAEEEVAWKNVLRLCSNYDTAHIQLAKLEIGQENYLSAMDRLSQINEKKNYGIAYGYARANWLEANFYWIVVALVGVIALIVVWKKCLSKLAAVARVRQSEYYKEVSYGKHVILHPFDGFWDLKREKRGSMRGALTILLLFLVFWGVRARFTGYSFTTLPYKDIRVFMDLITILIPILLWVVSNWCFTTLMDGKGTMKETFIAVCYALTPYVLISPIQLFLSYVLVNEEMAFYTYIDAIILIWVLALIFFGMMMTHDYTISKALISAVLTLVGICIILFLCLLIFNLFSEVYGFFYDLYQEISFRFY